MLYMKLNAGQSMYFLASSITLSLQFKLNNLCERYMTIITRIDEKMLGLSATPFCSNIYLSLIFSLQCIVGDIKQTHVSLYHKIDCVRFHSKYLAS